MCRITILFRCLGTFFEETYNEKYFMRLSYLFFNHLSVLLSIESWSRLVVSNAKFLLEALKLHRLFTVQHCHSEGEGKTHGYSSVPNRRACTFINFEEKIPPARPYLALHVYCFWEKNPPARLFFCVYKGICPARLLILRKKSPLHGLIWVCTFIDFEKKFLPARLFGSH